MLLSNSFIKMLNTTGDDTTSLSSVQDLMGPLMSTFWVQPIYNSTKQ